MQGDHPIGAAERAGTPTPAELGYPDEQALVIVRGWRDEHGDYQCQTVTDGWGCGRCAGCRAYAACNEGGAKELTETQDARRTINGTDGVPNDAAVFTYGGKHRLVIWQRPNGEPRTASTSMDFVRQHERNQRTISAIHTHNARVAAQRAARARQPARSRETHHASSMSTPRSIVAEASATGGDSSPSAPSGVERSGSTTALAKSDAPPPGRIRHRHEWIVARVSTRTPGSPASFQGVSS